MAEEIMEELDGMESLEGVEGSEDDAQKGKYMTFQIGGEFYGIAINYVNEIINMQPIAGIPEVEDYIKGLINIRGKIIPVIDVKVRFKQPSIDYTDRTCIIVIDVNSTTVGLIVEKIADVITIDEKQIIPPPSLNQSPSGKDKYVFGLVRVADEVKLLLDPEKLLSDEELEPELAE